MNFRDYMLMIAGEEKKYLLLLSLSDISSAWSSQGIVVAHSYVYRCQIFACERPTSNHMMNEIPQQGVLYGSFYWVNRESVLHTLLHINHFHPRINLLLLIFCMCKQNFAWFPIRFRIRHFHKAPWGVSSTIFFFKSSKACLMPILCPFLNLFCHVQCNT